MSDRHTSMARTHTLLGWILVGAPIALVLYTYVVYPLALWIIGRRRLARAGQGRAASAGHASREAPLVSIVVPAYNEATQIRETIESLLAQDYPADRRQILILSDASTDGTDEIVAGYAASGVELLRMPVRAGKTAAENASLPHLRGEIVVNSDASVRLHPSAVRLLVDAMADPRIGVASTCDVSIAPGAPTANAAEGGYVGYEMWLRNLETLTGGIVGASGSGYAIRATLHGLPVRGDLSRDFSAALTARTHGYSAVSVNDALCYVPRTASLRSEYRRKVRTVARGIDTLLFQRHLLDPMRYGLFAWKLFSHKACRWMVPPSGIPLAIGLALLAPTRPWAGIALGIGVAVGLIALAGAVWPSSRSTPRPLSLVTFAVAANLAVIQAVARVAYGHEDHLWEPTRRAPSTAGT